MEGKESPVPELGANLMKALSKFQAECPEIIKETMNEFGNYKYADLPKILDVINPILRKNNLLLIQPLTVNEYGRYIKTILYHLESNESIESCVDIPIVSMKGMNDYQALGSGITYLRRYSISSMLGLITDVDSDASGEQINTKNNSTAKSPQNKDKWLNREVPKNSGKITDDWYHAVAYLRGDIPREDSREPKLVDLQARFLISKQNREDLMNDVMDDNFKIPEK